MYRKGKVHPQSGLLESFTPADFTLPGVHGAKAVDFEVIDSGFTRRAFYRPQGAAPLRRRRSSVSEPFVEKPAVELGKIYAFSEIVSEDEDERFESFISKDLCGRLLESGTFRLFIFVVIIGNSLLVGLQTVPSLEKQSSSLMDAFDYVFLTIFMVEILIKWAHGFFHFWKVGWNVFDFALVAVSFLGNQLTFLSSGRVLRILRVLRAFRTLRSISVLRGLQMIVQTIVQSLPDMANIFLLLSIIMFIFSVIGVTLFGPAIPEYFGSLGQNMFTLFILLTQDGWVDIFKTMQKKASFLTSAIYCASFIIIGAFIFINILSGVTVTNLEQAYKELNSERRFRDRSLAADAAAQRQAQFQATAPVATVPPRVWLAQRPHEIPEFSNLSPTLLENYFLVTMAIEDNLAEFQRLKDQLKQIHDEVYDLNESLEMSDDEGESESDYTSSSGEESDTEDRWAGDILSRQILQDAKKKKKEEEGVPSEALEQRQRFLEFLQGQQSNAAIGSSLRRKMA